MLAIRSFTARFERPRKHQRETTPSANIISWKDDAVYIDQLANVPRAAILIVQRAHAREELGEIRVGNMIDLTLMGKKLVYSQWHNLAIEVTNYCRNDSFKFLSPSCAALSSGDQKVFSFQRTRLPSAVETGEGW